MFFYLGSYICEKNNTPECLEEISNIFISISDCLCNHEPQITKCHGWKPNGDKIEYINKLGISKEGYFSFSEEMQKFFDNNKLFVDGRFDNEKDAECVYRKYFRDLQYELISFATDEVNFYSLIEDGCKQEKRIISLKEGQVIGGDIVGFDNNKFHSFLCNSLQKEFDGLDFTELGLIDANYNRIKEMAEKIQGMGEPVNWIPVIIYKTVCEI